jgi:hypothetical protein
MPGSRKVSQPERVADGGVGAKRKSTVTLKRNDPKDRTGSAVPIGKRRAQRRAQRKAAKAQRGR